MGNEKRFLVVSVYEGGTVSSYFNDFIYAADMQDVYSKFKSANPSKIIINIIEINK